MSTVKISSALPDQVTLAAEIAQLRELDVSTLRARWRVVFRKDAPFHLPRHLLGAGHRPALATERFCGLARAASGWEFARGVQG